MVQTVFNEKFLDKNEVFDALKHNKELRRYLPESHLLDNYLTFKKMCSTYSSVFLKPVRGSLGKGIIRITKNVDGTFTPLHDIHQCAEEAGPTPVSQNCSQASREK